MDNLDILTKSDSLDILYRIGQFGIFGQIAEFGRNRTFWTVIGHFGHFNIGHLGHHFGYLLNKIMNKEKKRQKEISRTTMKKDSRAQKTSKIHTYISSNNTQVLKILSSKTSFSS